MPLFGLPDKVNIVRESESGSSYGTLTTGDTTQESSIRARLARPREEDESMFPGRGGGEMWTVVVKYSGNVAKNDRIEVVSSKKLDAGAKLRVLSCARQYDHRGVLHHLSIGAEREE